jgi:hypothetical protein
MKPLFYTILSALFFMLLPFHGFSQWDEKDKLVASDRQAGKRFSDNNAVAIYGEYAVVGASLHDTGSTIRTGAAYVYKRDANCNWIQVQRLTPTTLTAYESFGISVGIFDGTIVVGSYLNNEGRVYVFDEIGGTWTQTQVLMSSDPENGGAFGYDVDIFKDRIIVGSWGDDSGPGVPYIINSGAAYIFEEVGTTWVQTEKLVASDRGTQDWFGQAVSIYGNYAVVGSRDSEDENGLNTMTNSGSAYIYEKSFGSWNEVQKITSTDRGPGEYFGLSLDMNGNRIIVGVPSDDEDENGLNPLVVPGSAFIFNRNTTTGVWSVENKIVASDRESGDKFGSSVALFGDVAAVGIAFKELKTSTIGHGGAVYTFDFTSSGWTETQQFSHSDGAEWDRFGAGCELWKDRLIVNAPYEDEDDSTPPTNTLTDAGSAYIFEVTQPATQPTITNLSAGSACTGGTIDLAITGGNLNDAAEWQWYEGSCGGTLIGTGPTITVAAPTVATTYYANGVGGCVNDGLCGSITVLPNADSWPKRYGNASAIIERAQAIAVDNSGNVFVHGTVDAAVTFEDGSTVPGGGFLAKYDNCGDLLWVTDISVYGKEYSKLKVDNVGDPILLATTAIPPSDTDIEWKLTKFNSSNGTVQWSNTIEMKHILPWPSFDIDMNTNEVYLVANVNQYLRITQSNGTLIVNYTAPLSAYTYPRDMSYIIKYTSGGMQVWQDRMYANAGYAAFQDVVVAENTGRVYICGYAGNHPSPTGQIKFASNGFITMSPVGKSKLFITEYTTTTGVTQYSTLHPLIQGSATALQIDYSNTDDQIYVKNFKALQLFNSSAGFISSAVTFGKSGQMYYNQADNYALITGTTSSQKPEMQKFEGTTNIWTYTITGGTGYIYDAHPDPTSDQIFIAGSYWNTDLTLSSMDVLTLAGGRDAFISKVTDGGSTVQYLKKPVFAAENSEIKNLNETNDFGAEERELIVFPNPSTGLFNVQLELDNESSQQEVQVYSTTGRLVYSTTSDSNNFNIDLSEFDSGLYHLMIKTQNGVIQRKLIKQ